jgi:Zn-dependent M28 family amino/carboxypeptidase
MGTRVAPLSALGVVGGAPVDVKDWTPHGGSAEGEVEAEVVFVGHGISTRDERHDDYAGVDVRGRIALALAGAPAQLGRRVSRAEKLAAARAHGAHALLLVEDALPDLTATPTASPIPSASVRPAAADALKGHRARLRVALERVEVRGANVIGVLPGRDPALADETVIAGAHYDHVGRVDGAVHPGADDNASGTAVLIGLARAFAAAAAAPRTLVFAFFGAEELGLIGSGHYVKHPTRPLDRTVAMLNFDMVGRLRNEQLTAGGLDSGAGLRDVATGAASASGLTLVMRESPFGPSDHVRFYRAGVPVVFLHTGRHADYHRPTDTPDKLEIAGMARIAAVGARIVERLAAGPRPAYATVAPPARRGRGGSGGAYLGVQGDASGDGARLVSVMPGSAADRAGLREGDVVIRLGGAPLMSFDDLRAAIRDRRAGERVDVVFVRNGEQRSVTATLEAAP